MFQTGWLLNSVFVSLLYASLFLFCNADSGGATVHEETETALDILGILRNLKWDSPVFMTPSTKLGKILAVKSFAEQHQVTVISPSPPPPNSGAFLEDFVRTSIAKQNKGSTRKLTSC